MGALKASEPVVDEDAVDKYMATLLSPLLQVVVVPSTSTLVPDWQTSRVYSVDAIQFPEVEFELGTNLILSQNSTTTQG